MKTIKTPINDMIDSWKSKTWRATVNRYAEPEKFNRLWTLKNEGKATVGYWVGNIYMFEGNGQQV